MKLNEFRKNYITHYLLLENDFIETTQYVTIAEDNYDTYSVSFLKQLLTIGSEIDVMLEFVAKLYDPNTKETGFGCSKTILSYEEDIMSLEVVLREEDIIILPWKCKKIPEWWTAYNEIKHNRYETAVQIDSDKKYYQFANQKNVIYSLAALYSLELYAYRKIAIAEKEKIFVPTNKTIFTIKNSYWKDIQFGNGIVCFDGGVYIE